MITWVKSYPVEIYLRVKGKDVHNNTLSPLLFNFALEGILPHLMSSSIGYKLSNDTSVSTLGYADDIGKTKDYIQKALNLFMEFAEWAYPAPTALPGLPCVGEGTGSTYRESKGPLDFALDAATMTKTLKCLSSRDPIVSAVAWDQVGQSIHKRTGNKPQHLCDNFLNSPSIRGESALGGTLDFGSRSGGHIIEVVMFNCPERGIEVESFQILSTFTGNFDLFYPNTISCNSLVRVCIPCSVCNISVPFLRMSYGGAYLAELTFYDDRSCPEVESTTTITTWVSAPPTDAILTASKPPTDAIPTDTITTASKPPTDAEFPCSSPLILASVIIIATIILIVVQIVIFKYQMTRRGIQKTVLTPGAEIGPLYEDMDVAMATNPQGFNENQLKIKENASYGMV